MKSLAEGGATLPVVVFFPEARLHVVSGKGGTGKTTVAAALALALAEDGHRVLLCEVEGRQGIAPLLDVPHLHHQERKVARSSGGGEVDALAIDPEEALIEYLEMFYRMGRAGRLLRRLGAIDFVTTIAPGLRDVLLIGKVKEAMVRRQGAGHVYDAVVVDAPPTGRIVRFLGATDEVAQLAKVGPIRAQSESVMATLRSAQTAIHLVTLLEEMPVQETVDGVTELHRAGLPVGAVFINKVSAPELSDEDMKLALARRLDLDEISAALQSIGLDAGPDVVKVLADEAAEHARRVELQREELVELEALDAPLLELPLLPSAHDLAGLRELAEEIRDQW